MSTYPFASPPPLQDFQLIVDQLDDLAQQAEARLPATGERYPLRVLQVISSLLNERGFQGNREVSTQQVWLGKQKAWVWGQGSSRTVCI